MKPINTSKILKMINRKISLINNYEESFKDIEHHIISPKEPPKSILAYTPIFLVTNIEVIAKEIISIFIDYGEPYSSNVKTVSQNHTLKFEDLSILNRKQVTFGELISSLLKFNSFHEVYRQIQQILGEEPNVDKFLKDVFEANEQPISDISFEDRKKHLFHIYKIRHQIVHESSTVKISHKDAINHIKITKLFLKGLIQFTENLTEPPENQLGMNFFYGEENTSVSDLLTKKINLISKTLRKRYSNSVDDEKRIKILNGAMVQWKKFVKEISEFDAYNYKGGSLYSTQLSGSQTSYNRFLLELIDQYYSEETLLDETF